MTTILISVLAPVVLLGWWVLIVTAARDNVVIPASARARIKMKRAVISVVVNANDAVRCVVEAMAALAPVVRAASRRMQELREPLSKAGVELCDDGGDEQ